MSMRGMRTPRRQRGAEAAAYRALYGTGQWRALRASHLMREPLCVMCQGHGRLTAAAVVDHRVPHRGDRGLFFDPGNLQSLCAHHHNSVKQSWERRGLAETGLDGWPVRG